MLDVWLVDMLHVDMSNVLSVAESLFAIDMYTSSSESSAKHKWLFMSSAKNQLHKKIKENKINDVNICI